MCKFLVLLWGFGSCLSLSSCQHVQVILLCFLGWISCIALSFCKDVQSILLCLPVVMFMFMKGKLNFYILLWRFSSCVPLSSRKEENSCSALDGGCSLWSVIARKLGFSHRSKPCPTTVVRWKGFLLDNKWLAREISPNEKLHFSIK